MWRCYKERGRCSVPGVALGEDPGLPTAASSRVLGLDDADDDGKGAKAKFFGFARKRDRSPDWHLQDAICHCQPTYYHKVPIVLCTCTDIPLREVGLRNASQLK